jgi:hypothetical protein
MRVPLAACARIVLLLGLLASPLWLLRQVDRVMPATHSDFVPVRVGTQIALAGGDPYSEQSTRSIQCFYYGRPLTANDRVNKMGFAYPIYTALELAPLATIPWEVFRLGFLCLMPLLLAASVPAWMQTLGFVAGRTQTATIAVLFVASWPAMWALRLQQVSLIVDVLMALGCLLVVRRRDGLAGLTLGLCLIKPQLAAPLLAWMTMWTLLERRHRRWRFACSLAGTTGGLLAWSLIRAPGWIPRWIAAMQDYTVYTEAHPGLVLILGSQAGSVVQIAVAVCCGIALFKLRRSPAGSTGFAVAIALVLAATDCLNPTTLPMSYNQVFLLPGCLVLLFSRPDGYYVNLARKSTFMLVATDVLLAPLAAVLGGVTGKPEVWAVMPFETLLVPVAVTATLCAIVLAGEPLLAIQLPQGSGARALIDS